MKFFKERKAVMGQLLFWHRWTCIACLAILAAGSINCMDSGTSPKSNFIDAIPVLKNLKNFESMILTQSRAFELSEPFESGAPLGTLVLADAQDGTYHLAFVKHSIQDWESFLAYDYATKKDGAYPVNSSRKLKFLPQIVYQPHLPDSILADFFRIFLECHYAYEDLPYLEASIIPADSHIASIGDLHADSHALRNILKGLYSRRIIDKRGILAPNNYIVFTGDLADRGPRGPEVWHLFLQLKALNPNRVFTTRGNHETTEAISFQNFFRQLSESTHLDAASVAVLLNKLFYSMPHGLLMGVAPQPLRDSSQNPYRFLLFCHAGMDPIVPLKKFMQSVVEKHKKMGQEHFLSHFSHHDPEYSGLLWTDFRANRFEEEPATREPSVRAETLHVFNTSAILDFFDEHASEHPDHPYELNAMVRGHQHQYNGVGRLSRVAKSELDDWIILKNQRKERIAQGSVYNCTSSTKWSLPSDLHIVSFLDIEFSDTENVWHVTPNIISQKTKTLLVGSLINAPTSHD